MESVIWSKLDQGMRIIYRSYLSFQEKGRADFHPQMPIIKQADDVLTVSIQYEGISAQLTDFGFVPNDAYSPNTVEGDLRIGDVQRATHHPAVQRISFGMPLHASLDTTTTIMGVRTTSSAPNNGLWFYDGSAGPNPGIGGGNNAFGGNRGEGVVIGVIDTGIDWEHPCFHATDFQTTRIHSIWDQGLSRRQGESAPAASLLSSSSSYGVEYEANDLGPNNDNPRVRTTDTEGHGTHVASIAAGNGGYMMLPLQTEKHRHFAGVAPEATLIVVKFLNVRSRKPFFTRFRDAVTYILRKAAAISADTPVVINGSIGSVQSPHDGQGMQLTNSWEGVLHDLLHGQAGKIGVFSAGNKAGSASHFRITIPAGGTIDIPCQIVDGRTNRRNTPNLNATFFYSGTVAGLTVRVKAPRRSNFFRARAAGEQDTHAIGPSSRNALTIEHFTAAFNGPHGAVNRNGILIDWAPYRQRFDRREDYTIRLAGPAGTVIHLWTEPQNAQLRLTFTTSANIVDDPTALIGGPASSPDVITVANFGLVDNGGGNVERHLFCSSARGPLLNYSGGSPIVSKPDIAAPGVAINGARPLSAIARIGRTTTPGQIGNQGLPGLLGISSYYVPMTGTSMSCPFVAGTVALMLKKNGTLTKNQVLTLLQTHGEDNLIRHKAVPQCSDNPTDIGGDVVPVSSSDPIAGTDQIGGGRLNARASVQNVPNP
ncbi:MAG: S8 family serine peptidase [Bacteroidota bacterium]